MATSAPAFAIANAIVLPRRRAPPVTHTALPSSGLKALMLYGFYRKRQVEPEYPAGEFTLQLPPLLWPAAFSLLLVPAARTRQMQRNPTNLYVLLSASL